LLVCYGIERPVGQALADIKTGWSVSRLRPITFSFIIRSFYSTRFDWCLVGFRDLPALIIGCVLHVE